MKKILFLVSIFVFVSFPVYAKENKLYFTESDNRIYYESKLLDSKFFMNHINMLPGDSFTDTLNIENGTNTNYKLYFKVLPREQSQEADNLLENITMKISIDDKYIYDGKVTGLDYTDKGINLKNAILLGDFNPSKTSTMIVETTLSKYYDNTEFNDFSYIDWVFYAQYDDSEPMEIVKAPNTMKNSFPYMVVFSILIILFGLSIIGYAHKKEN